MAQHLKIRNGINPVEERASRRTEKTLAVLKNKTFKECAALYIEAHSGEWRNPKHIKQWESTLATYAFPVFGGLSVSQIDTGLVLVVLQQKTQGQGGQSGEFWKVKNETASRLRGRIEAILDWATVRKYRTGDNPARWSGHLEHELPKPGKVQDVQHYKSLPWQQVGEFVQKLRGLRGVPSAIALEFLILTAARSGEVRGATWDEIDLEKKVWTVPAKRMKAGQLHRVPLSAASLSLLRALPRIEGTNLLFPSIRKNVAMSDMVFSQLLARMGYDITAHGFRSTFRTWGGEQTNYPHDVMEHALAHKEPDPVVEAYSRTDLYEKRIKLMDDWAEFADHFSALAV
ncbi:phage integrase [Betaproteobacteria bacterium]|nr:phage integrase [Betaproteobacteria bacterium]